MSLFIRTDACSSMSDIFCAENNVICDWATGNCTDETDVNLPRNEVCELDACSSASDRLCANNNIICDESTGNCMDVTDVNLPSEEICQPTFANTTLPLLAQSVGYGVGAFLGGLWRHRP